MGEKAATKQGWTQAMLRVVEPKKGKENTLWEWYFDFNPKDYSITRAAEWTAPTNQAGSAPAHYVGPRPASLTVEMFLDQSNLANGDISPIISKLISYVNPESNSKQKQKPSAPHIHFLWGGAISFKGYLEQVAVKYTLFRQNGNPIRGTATLTLKEILTTPDRQNPTSGGPPGNRAHLVVAGDTLASIAYAEYGNANQWRVLGDANPEVDDPMRLRPGTSLLIPPA